MKKRFVVLLAAVVSVVMAGTGMAESIPAPDGFTAAEVEDAQDLKDDEEEAEEAESGDDQAEEADVSVTEAEEEESQEEASEEEAAEETEAEEEATEESEAGEPETADTESVEATTEATATAPSAPAAANAEVTPEAQTQEQEEEAFEYEDVFAQWNEDAPALQALIDYVEDITDETSPNFIPVEDRVAVFDMDGTVYGELFPTYLEYYMLAWRILEDPSIEPDAEMLEVGRTLRDCALDNSFPEDMPMQHAIQAARAYAGMTLDEFSDFVTEVLLRDVDGFEGMTYGEAFYQPIIEVVDYLNDNGFSVYLVSGSDRYLCRTLIEGVLDIPADHVIGMDVYLEGTGQEGADSLNYVFQADDDVIRTDRLMIKNLKMNKVYNIAQEIGRQPVLSFGNSSGDVSMHEYTINKNKYRSAAFMLVADDADRDYANLEKTEPLKDKWADAGYIVISMKNDFRTIYGEDVVKTGTFHWMEELAEDRVPVDAGEPAADEAAEEAAQAEEPEEAEEAVEAEEPEEAEEAVEAEEAADAAETEEAAQTAEEPEAASDASDVQYVLYLGTNDKDTNLPVFAPEEAKETLKEILCKYFGGYTIQEAEGGWVDEEGVLFQEFTLVIYLSDTTLDQVHAACDELRDVFHQSSVLIQSNQTVTEFYAG